MHQKKGRSSQRGKRIQRSNFFTSAGSDGRLVLQKEWHVRSETCRQFVQPVTGQRAVEKLIQSEQCRRSVTAATPETCGERNLFFEVNFNAVFDSSGFEECRCGAMHEVRFVNR